MLNALDWELNRRGHRLLTGGVKQILAMLTAQGDGVNAADNAKAELGTAHVRRLMHPFNEDGS